ncbi:MAG TPA: nuclear transport factor 2 family protein [Blastocatellia bacterium]|nr:nuclear transport factor 2 family protein [Blastocatellia bacterium]
MATEQEGQYQLLIENYFRVFNNPSSTFEDLEEFLHPEIVWQEMPNCFGPIGRIARLDAIRPSWERGREFLAEQEYILQVIIVSGDTAAVRFIWRGKISKSIAGLAVGTELSGQIASFFQFRDDKIVKQVDYPCYDPIPNSSTDETQRLN